MTAQSDEGHWRWHLAFMSPEKVEIQFKRQNQHATPSHSATNHLPHARGQHCPHEPPQSPQNRSGSRFSLDPRETKGCGQMGLGWMDMLIGMGQLGRRGLFPCCVSVTNGINGRNGMASYKLHSPPFLPSSSKTVDQPKPSVFQRALQDLCGILNK